MVAVLYRGSPLLATRSFATKRAKVNTAPALLLHGQTGYRAKKQAMFLGARAAARRRFAARHGELGELGKVLVVRGHVLQRASLSLHGTLQNISTTVSNKRKVALRDAQEALDEETEKGNIKEGAYDRVSKCLKAIHEAESTFATHALMQFMLAQVLAQPMSIKTLLPRARELMIEHPQFLRLLVSKKIKQPNLQRPVAQ